MLSIIGLRTASAFGHSITSNEVQIILLVGPVIVRLPVSYSSCNLFCHLTRISESYHPHNLSRRLSLRFFAPCSYSFSL